MKVVFTKAQAAAFEKYFGETGYSMEKARDFSKLHKETTIDKNGRKMTVYVSNEPKKAKVKPTVSSSSAEENLFGHNYSAFTGKGKAAIEKLMREKNGYVKAAFYKEGIGDIDVIYGKVTNAEHHKGYGIAHILDKHPDMTAGMIAAIIKKGEVQTRDKGFNIKLGRYTVGINKYFKKRGKILVNNNWVVTSFEDKTSNGKSRHGTRQRFYKQSDPISLQNPSDNATLPHSDGTVKKTPKKGVKKSAKGKKWIWIGKDGHVYIKKSAADAFWRGLAEERRDNGERSGYSNEMEKARDYSNLHQETVIDKNGQPRKVWKRNEELPKNEGRVKSGKKTKEEYRKKAVAVLRSIKNTDLVNEAEHKIARIGNKGISKMTSDEAIGKSVKNGFTMGEHFFAVNNIKELWRRAKLVATHRDASGAKNLLIHRYVATGRTKRGVDYDALLTVKETTIMKNGKRIYSLELDKLNRASQRWAIDNNVTQSNQGKAPTGSSKYTLPQHGDSVNENSGKNVKKSAKSKKWIWIDSNGKVWIRKSALEAWNRA